MRVRDHMISIFSYTADGKTAGGSGRPGPLSDKAIRAELERPWHKGAARAVVDGGLMVPRVFVLRGGRWRRAMGPVCSVADCEEIARFVTGKDTYSCLKHGVQIPERLHAETKVLQADGYTVGRVLP